MPALYLFIVVDRWTAIPAAGAHALRIRELGAVAIPARVCRPKEAKTGTAVTHSTAVSDPGPNANVQPSDPVMDYH